MMRIPDPVHEAQSCASEKAFAEVVLYHDAPAHANGLLKQQERVINVVQHVHEHYGVEGRVRIGDVDAVEGANGNFRSGPDEDVNALDADSGLLPCDAGRPENLTS